MKLYKFRSSSEFDFIVDILRYHRFHASLFKNLNDPMEGVFKQYSAKKTISKLSKVINDKQKEFRICSFSKTYKRLLLWAHYAEQFKGVCFEVEILSPNSFEILEIDYAPEPPCINWHEQDYRDIYSWKHEDWIHEEEIRLLTSNSYIDTSIKINSIFFGLRTESDFKWAIRKILPSDIKAFNTKMDYENSKIQIGQQL